jgi:mono/diheme cytochrome c family protein
MRYFLFCFGLIVLAVMLVAGKRGSMSRKPPMELFPDMDRQPKLRPEEADTFFKDGLSSRLPVPGTVARGTPYADTPVNTGKIPGTTNWVEAIPVPITHELMARGRQRFNINCSPCHGKIGDGKGITSKYGMLTTANLHDLRLVKMTAGEIFNTITHGKNLMGAYGSQTTIEDRWAIIAYVRALQRSQLASLEDVPAAEREKLTQPLPPGAAAQK